MYKLILTAIFSLFILVACGREFNDNANNIISDDKGFHFVIKSVYNCNCFEVYYSNVRNVGFDLRVVLQEIDCKYLIE